MRAPHQLLIAAACVIAAGCGAAAGAVTAPRSPELDRWTRFIPAPSPIDVARGRSAGGPVVAADGGLYLLNGSRLGPFAPSYRSPAGLEAYIALPAPSHPGCSFGRNTVYAIRFQHGRGVSRVSPGGRVSRFATISAPGLINGITFD